VSHSRFADAATARQAVASMLPTIEAALADQAISGLGVLHLVLADPAACWRALALQAAEAARGD
jgi:hypothetical protein